MLILLDQKDKLQQTFRSIRAACLLKTGGAGREKEGIEDQGEVYCEGRKGCRRDSLRATNQPKIFGQAAVLAALAAAAALAAWTRATLCACRFTTGKRRAVWDWFCRISSEEIPGTWGSRSKRMQSVRHAKKDGDEDEEEGDKAYSNVVVLLCESDVENRE
jgi:hypothetical protein